MSVLYITKDNCQVDHRAGGEGGGVGLRDNITTRAAGRGQSCWVEACAEGGEVRWRSADSSPRASVKGHKEKRQSSFMQAQGPKNC